MSQSAFRRALMDPDCALPPGLIDPQGRPAPKRFAIYRNNVAVGLTAALEDGFAVVQRLVGEEFFAAMAGVFIRQHPPTSPILMFYGADFPDFLTDFSPVAHLGYLPDVARLEFALRESYHAADAHALPLEVLARMPAETLMACRLRLAPSLRLVQSHWPIHGIWQANTGRGPAPQMRPEDVVILRTDYDPMPHLLPAGGAEVIAALMAGQTLAQALETAPDADPAAILAPLIQGQAIVETLL